MKSVNYYEDVDHKDVIVRCSEYFCIEEISRKRPYWSKVPSNCSYEREILIGQGNCCLFPITEEEALQRIKEWTSST